MLFDQSNEVCRCIPCERRFYEVWIRRYEMFRLAIDVGEITSAPARNKNLFARAIGVLNHRHAAATFTSLHGTHKPSGTGTKN